MVIPDDSRRYVIIRTADKPNVNFAEVLEDENYLRYSLDGAYFILKFEGNTPPSISTLSPTEYTYEEIQPLLEGSNWKPEEEVGVFD